MSARKTAPLAVLVGLALALTGCGTDHGQANALAACRLFSSANGGGLVGADLTAKLAEAEHYATKASKQSAIWDTLTASLTAVTNASNPASGSGYSKTAMHDAITVINSSCSVAARGY